MYWLLPVETTPVVEAHPIKTAAKMIILVFMLSYVFI